MSYALTLLLTALNVEPLEANTIDLSAWTTESYAVVAGTDDGRWTIAPDGQSVHQDVNGQPTMFYSDFFVGSSVVDVLLEVAATAGDDDIIGFALGFRAGDSSSTTADYLLVDWKKGTQTHDFGAPSDTPGSTSVAGLAVSRVRGLPTADEFWGHVNFDHAASDLNSGLEELDRGTVAGWEHGRLYAFRLAFTETSLDVYLDGLLELSITGDFQDGSLAFYNFSQSGTTYSSATIDPCELLTSEQWLSGLPPVGNALRLSDHGDPRGAVIDVTLRWDADESQPRTRSTHYHVLRATEPRGRWRIVALPEVETQSHVDSAPSDESSIHYYSVLAADDCERLSSY